MTIITEYHNGLKVCGQGDLHKACLRSLNSTFIRSFYYYVTIL